jgi:hypothetical protein
MISRTVLLPFGHRVDEMEAILVPGNRQHRFPVIDPSSRPDQKAGEKVPRRHTKVDT